MSVSVTYARGVSGLRRSKGENRLMGFFKKYKYLRWIFEFRVFYLRFVYSFPAHDGSKNLGAQHLLGAKWRLRRDRAPRNRPACRPSSLPFSFSSNWAKAEPVVYAAMA